VDQIIERKPVDMPRVTENQFLAISGLGDEPR